MVCQAPASDLNILACPVPLTLWHSKDSNHFPSKDIPLQLPDKPENPEIALSFSQFHHRFCHLSVYKDQATVLQVSSFQPHLLQQDHSVFPFQK